MRRRGETTGARVVVAFGATVLVVAGCGSEGPRTTVTNTDAGPPDRGVFAFDLPSTADIPADTGPAGGRGLFVESWRSSAMGRPGTQVADGGLPAMGGTQPPVIVRASGTNMTEAVSLTLAYRAYANVNAAIVAPQGAEYSIVRNISAPMSPDMTRETTFDIPLPANLARVVGSMAFDLPVGIVLRDVMNAVSNLVVVQFHFEPTSFGAPMLRVQSPRVCDARAAAFCLPNGFSRATCNESGESYTVEDCMTPRVCRNGACFCPPQCTAEGRMCGVDSCGNTCGTCMAGRVCNTIGQCVEDPALVGCADGTREGFTDRSVYPGVASCRAQWPRQSMRATRTRRDCGNSLGPCTVPEDACSPGWHICMRNGWPADLRSRLPGEDCRSAVAGSGRFLAAASHAVDRDNCAGPIPCNAVFSAICCGSACDINIGDRGINSCVWSQATPWVSWTACADFASVNDGVLCCQDPPAVGM